VSAVADTGGAQGRVLREVTDRPDRPDTLEVVVGASVVVGVPPALLAGLLDDAATFPPGNASVLDAVQAREMYAEAWFAELLGAVVVRADRIDGLVGALAETRAAGRGAAPLPVTVTVPEGLTGILAAVRAARHPALRVVAFEVPVGAGDADAEVLSTVRMQVPAGVAVHVELSGHVDASVAMPVLAMAGVRGKLRTGGTSAADSPPVEAVARFVHEAVAARVPFKATAGLHNALRHRDEDTGVVHHGFLNLLAATAAALEGADADAVGRLVASTGPEPVLEVLLALDPDRARAVRRAFVGFGTCSTVEPVEDLAGLGLLVRPGWGA